MGVGLGHDRLTLDHPPLNPQCRFSGAPWQLSRWLPGQPGSRLILLRRQSFAVCVETGAGKYTLRSLRDGEQEPAKVELNPPTLDLLADHMPGRGLVRASRIRYSVGQWQKSCIRS